MILLEVHASYVPILPLERHAPRTVHVETVPDGLPLEPMEVEAGDVQVGQQHGFIERLEPHERSALEVRANVCAPARLEQLAESGVPEASDHRRIVSRTRRHTVKLCATLRT